VALAQVQAGETSVEEVLRVLKHDSESGGSTSSRSRGGSPPAPPSGSPPRTAPPSSRGTAPPAPARGRSAQPRQAGP
jgi:hypothetical protein